MTEKEPRLEEGDGLAKLAAALTWYTQNKTIDDSIEYVKKHLKNEKFILDNINKFDRSRYPASAGWIIRMRANGSYVPEEEYVKALHRLRTTPIRERKEAAVVEVTQPTKTKKTSYIGVIDGYIDDACESSFKKKASVRSYLKSLPKVDQDAVSRSIKHTSELREEVELAISGKDPQVKEAYSIYKKNELKLFQEYLMSIIAELEEATFTNKVVKARARKVKSVPASKLVKNMRYKSHDKDLNLVSHDPVDVVHKSVTQVWVYNTKSRDLCLYNFTDGCTVKGASFVGYDEATSIKKKLRKPDETIKSLMEQTKPSLKKFMATIKTKGSAVSPRMTADSMILRIVK